MQHQTLYHHVHSAKKDDNKFMIECSECKAWIHYQCTELPLYMIASLVEGRKEYSCTSCININETLEKYTKTLKTNKPGENEPSFTIPEKEIEKVKHLLSEKETEIQKLDDSKTVNENKIADMKHEIGNLKNEKQVQLNLIQLKKQEIYEKYLTIEQYEKENSNHKLALKKQETLIKAITERRNKLQNELDQTKTEMTIQQKELSELIQNHQQLQRKYLESQDSCSAKEANIHQLEEILKRNEHTIKKLQSNLELYRNKCTNYNDETELNEGGNDDTSENTKTNKNNLQTILEHNKHDYMKIDPKSNNDNQEQSTSKNALKAETTCKQNNDKIKQIISVPTYLIGNIIWRNGHRIKSIQTQNNVVIQTKYC